MGLRLMKIHDIVMKLLIQQPFYGYVASTVNFTETDKTETIKMATTPNLVIYYNPVWFSSLTDDKQMGVIIHELLHVILMHQFRRENREIMIWSVACDIAVNQMIQKAYLPETSITIEVISKKLKREIEKNKNAEFYYNILCDVDELLNLSMISDDVFLLFESDDNYKSGKISDECASSMEIEALKMNMSQMIEDARSEGEIPAGIVDEAYEVYNDLKINWRVILKRFLEGRGKILVRKYYKRVSRRYDNLPGTKRSVGVNALLAIDESGSISDDLVRKFHQELLDINKITGVSIMVITFDTECSSPVSLSKFVVNQKRQKRGGTDFRPVFELADELKVSLVIIFTDGDGEAPVSVNQKTLWVLTGASEKPAEYGYYISFEG